MKYVFSFRLDRVMNEKLRRLAEQTQRSKGGVLRWLITNAQIEAGTHDLGSVSNREVSDVTGHEVTSVDKHR